MNTRAIVFLILLIAAGFLGNYFTVPLFFGADFLFGSIAVLLALYFYGLGWGLLAAVLVHSYTYVLWGHPYGFLNFVSEALFVGLFLKHGRRNLLALDGAFWLLLGMPLAWLYHGVLLQMDATTATFIMLKQAVNGVFNAMLVSLAVCFLPLDRLFRRQPQPAGGVSLQESLFNLLVMMVLLPALLLTMLQISDEKQNLDKEIVTEISSISASLQLNLHTWFQQHLLAVQELASLACHFPMTPTPWLQQVTEILKQTFPDFIGMHVTNMAGRTIAFSPLVNEMGESTLGHDFSDRLWFKDARAQRQPVVSELILGRIGVFAPITVIAVPVIRGDQFLGTAGAALNLKKVQDLLQPYSQGKTRVITLSDFHNRIIASTAPERTPMQVWERKKTGVYQPLNAQMYHWYPDDPQLPSMTRWKQSFYVQEISLAPELPWKLFIEAPVAPLQQTLYAIYVKNLAIMALLMTLALFFSLLVSRTLTRPLAQLSRVTADLPGKLFDVRNLDWPGSSSLEINALIANAKSMAQTMEENFHNLQSQSNELRQSLSLQNATLESTADGILVVNLQGKIVSANKKFREMWRIPEEIVNAGDDEQALAYVLQQLADPPSFLAKVGELYAQPAAESFDLIHFQDGRVFERYSIPQYLDEQIVGRVWSFRDVTTRTLVEEALYQSEAKYRALVETTATGYVIIDSQGQVLDANPEYVRLSGHRTQEEIIRRKATEWIAPHDQERYGAAVAACAAQGFVRHLEIDYLGPGGRVLPVEINATCLRTGDDYKILSLVHDITDRKQDEAGRLQVSKLESLATLAGGIAHDFNNILTAIMGNIGLAMLDYQRGEHNRARLQEAEKACLQAKTLARQLLTFAKGGAPVKELVSLGNIIAEAVSFASRGSQVKCDLSAAADLWAVEADPGQISQVFQNLVINAVQAMPTGGTLEVLGENLEVKAGESQNLNPGRYVKISFQDQGIGIPEEYLPKIFDPYFTTKQTGSGLGLATAYSIVKSHQGHLGVESRLGKGAVFQVYLPASEQAFAPPVVDEGKVQQGQGRILVMDDEDMVRKLLGDALSFLGYEACFAGEGKEALKLFLEGEKTGQNFDAVILDLTVPAGMGGKETLGELLKINPRVKVIVSSGYSEDPVMAKFEEYGFAGVIAKPYRVSEISKVLHAVIGKVT